MDFPTIALTIAVILASVELSQVTLTIWEEADDGTFKLFEFKASLYWKIPSLSKSIHAVIYASSPVLLKTFTGTVNEVSPILRVGNVTTPSLSSAPSPVASTDDCWSSSASGTLWPKYRFSDI